MTTKNENKTTLHLKAPRAERVFLAGNFNEWKTDALAMRRSKDGDWSIDLALPPGRYEYKFVVDGNWCCDVSNDAVVEAIDSGVPNDFGTMNRVLEIRS
ncbi:MAG: glycoside hydrolase family 13 [Deltaproteobacteria bacterium]|nr:glycoside hydrolase family 13 [Deltaproteobacteria bacterium]